MGLQRSSEVSGDLAPGVPVSDSFSTVSCFTSKLFSLMFPVFVPGDVKGKACSSFTSPGSRLLRDLSGGNFASRSSSPFFSWSRSRSRFVEPDQ